MHVFVTGATGFIGSAVVNELISAGHRVTGLSRSQAGTAALEAAGTAAVHGTLEDHAILAQAATEAEGVIHLAFTHDFSNFAHAQELDLGAVKAMGAALVGSGKPFITTAHANGQAIDQIVLDLAPQGVRSAVVMLSPSVHGRGDKGFVPMLIAIARQKGCAAYIAAGTNRWPAIHRLDAAVLYRRALESVLAGARLLGAGDEGISMREIAELIGHHLKLPTLSLSPDEAAAHFGFLGTIVGLDISGLYQTAQASPATQALLDWKPIQPGLIADMHTGDYF